MSNNVQPVRDSAAILREKGLRLTPQRLVILNALQKGEHHISAEEIYRDVCSQFPQINISTVYRTLETLKKLGLVMQVDVGAGRIFYHRTDKGHHHHLVCQNCGARIELDEAFLAPLRDSIQRQYQFKADLMHLTISGHCEYCKDS